MARLTDLEALLRAARGDQAAARPAASATRPAAASPRRAESTPAVAVATPGKVAAPKGVERDIDIAQAFSDVARLRPRNRATPTRPRPPAVPRLRIEDERDALEMSKYGVEPAPHTWDIGQELEAGQTFVRRGLGSDVLVKLRRGHWVVQRVLDLHRMTSAEAHDTLADFLLEARSHGLRCIRVIHGKGRSSPNREPVLKGKVRRWLSQWDDVLAYSEAAPHAGGSGAVVVLLRGR